MVTSASSLAFRRIVLLASVVLSTIVLCGTASPAYRVKGDEIKGVYEADCGALGKVTLTID